MQEGLLLKKKSTTTADLSVVFSSASVGDRTFIDRSKNARVFTRGVIAGTPAVADGVVNDPTFGMCYRFNQYTYFNCTNILQFSTRNFRLEMDFVPMGANNRNNTLFRSGDFNAHGNQAGLLINLNQFPASYFQGFFSTGSNFTRTYLNSYTNPGQVMEQMVITKNNNNVTITNNRNGLSSTTGILAMVGDTYLAFGCSDNLGSDLAFDGLLKRLELWLT